jgi:hypothetical protein
MCWTFVRDESGTGWLARRVPAADANLIRAVETFVFEFGRPGKIAMFIDDWVMGAALDPAYRSGTEGVRVELVDSTVVLLKDVYGQFQDTQLSRTDFRAMLAGFIQAISIADGA